MRVLARLTVVGCGLLVLSGCVAVVPPPDSGKLKADYGSWIPYFSVRQVDADWVLDDGQLHRDCPVSPPGTPDPGYFG